MFASEQINRLCWAACWVLCVLCCVQESEWEWQRVRVSGRCRKSHRVRERSLKVRTNFNAIGNRFSTTYFSSRNSYIFYNVQFFAITAWICDRFFQWKYSSTNFISLKDGDDVAKGDGGIFRELLFALLFFLFFLFCWCKFIRKLVFVRSFIRCAKRNVFNSLVYTWPKTNVHWWLLTNWSNAIAWYEIGFCCDEPNEKRSTK